MMGVENEANETVHLQAEKVFSFHPPKGGILSVYLSSLQFEVFKISNQGPSNHPTIMSEHTYIKDPI